MRFHAVFASFALFSACASAGSSLQLDVTETSSSEYCNVWDGYSCSDSDTGFRIAYGYDFNANFGFQFGYQDGGETAASYSEGSQSANTNTAFTAFDLVAVGRISLSDTISLYGRAGLAKWDTDSSYTYNVFSMTETDSFSQSDTTLTYGIGAQIGWFTVGYDVVDAVKLCDDPSCTEGEVERLSAGVRFEF